MNRHMLHVGKMLVASAAGLTLCAGCGTQVGIAASPSEIYVEVGGTATVSVVAVMDIGSPVVVSESLTISSSDEAIAVVSGQDITGIAEGTAVLAITDGVFTTTANVHVVAAGTLPAELVVTPTSVFCTPESDDTQLEAFAVFTTGAGEDVTDRTLYSSSDSSIAVVTTQGVVVCVGEGETSITAEYLGVSEAVEVVVGAIAPRALNFSSSTLACTAGELYEVQVLASWEDGTTTDVSLSATYSSSDTSVATALLGQVYCQSEGTANIIAAVSGVTSVLSVEVEAVAADPNELVDLRISPSSIDCGLAQVAEFAVIAEFGDGSTVDVTGSSETQYLSSDSSIVALVVVGQVWCVQQGQAIVQASYGDLVASATVTVQ